MTSLLPPTPSSGAGPRSGAGAPPRRRRGAPTWVLNLGSLGATAAVLIGGLVYAGANPKVANAPLQPPVAVPTAAPAITRTFERDRDDDDDDDDRAIPTPRPTARTQPRATLAPGIRTTPQTPTTRTRVS